MDMCNVFFTLIFLKYYFLLFFFLGHLMTMTPEQLQAYRWEREIDERNRPFTDDELDSMFPPGYKVLTPPAGKEERQ